MGTIQRSRGGLSFGQRGALAALLVVALVLSSGVAARATEPWSGYFVEFAAGSATTDVNNDYTEVWAGVSEPANDGYRVSIYDADGNRMCKSSVPSSPTGCAFTSSPGTNSTETYLAFVALDSPLVGFPTNDVRATAGPISVTNTGWTGSFTLFAPDSATTDVNNDYTFVNAEVSPRTDGGYRVSIYDADGNRLCRSSSTAPKTCAITSSPATNDTEAYFAFVALDAPAVGFPTNDVRASAGPVTVTNTGWSGSFTEFSAESSITNSSQDYTFVTAEVDTRTEGGYRVSVYDADGNRACKSSSNYPKTCGFTSRPATNTTETYTAFVALDSPLTGFPTNDVRATAGPVHVTNVGWRGEFTSAEVQTDDYEFLGATSGTFEWDEPLDAFVHVDIVDSAGDVLGTCSSTGDVSCSAARALGPDESELVHAEARVSLPTGGQLVVATSESVELTGMDADGYANFLLTAPEPTVAALVGTARAGQAMAARTAVQTSDYCYVLGLRFPSNALFHSSVPDAALLCYAGTAVVLAFMIRTMGVSNALEGMASVGEPDGDGDPSPEPGAGGGDGYEEPPGLPPGDYLCEPIGPNGEEFGLKPQEFYTHILRYHMDGDLTAAKSQWDQDLFGGDNTEALKDLLCEALERGPDDYGYNPETGNSMRIYTNQSGDVGRTVAGSTRQFTIVVRPDGTVASAYPGTAVSPH